MLTENEIVELEIERRACLITAAEMAKGDAIISTDIREMCCSLQKRAWHIGEQIA